VSFGRRKTLQVGHEMTGEQNVTVEFLLATERMQIILSRTILSITQPLLSLFRRPTPLCDETQFSILRTMEAA